MCVHPERGLDISVWVCVKHTLIMCVVGVDEYECVYGCTCFAVGPLIRFSQTKWTGSDKAEKTVHSVT